MYSLAQPSLQKSSRCVDPTCITACYVQLHPPSAALHWMSSFPVSCMPIHLHNLFVLYAYKLLSEAIHLSPTASSISNCRLRYLLEQTLYKVVAQTESHFNAAYASGLIKKKKRKNAEPGFQRDSFKVAKQIQYLNAESQVRKREEKKVKLHHKWTHKCVSQEEVPHPMGCFHELTLWEQSFLGLLA